MSGEPLPDLIDPNNIPLDLSTAASNVLKLMAPKETVTGFIVIASTSTDHALCGIRGLSSEDAEALFLCALVENMKRQFLKPN